MKKFHIIIIDSGWPTAAHQALRESMEMLKKYLAGHLLLILTEKESRELLVKFPEVIGRDPVIIITDIERIEIRHKKERELIGIKIELGKINNSNSVIKYLQEICRLIRHKKFIADISWDERKKTAEFILKDVVEYIFSDLLGIII